MRALSLVAVFASLLFAEEYVRPNLSLKPFNAVIKNTAASALPAASLAKTNTIEQFAKVYAASEVEFENLKAVTLAMMLLESGRGTSDLAKKYNNFGGLKYRPEMAAMAKKIRYYASDGYDYYCHFASFESFIAGFWTFLDRKPYEGWRTKALDERKFLEFIAPIYCPYNSDYANSVMKLLPEARALLAKHVGGGYRVAAIKE
ncbi:MAG: glucosaminidase domain-containing protein [Helicobacteraceae bacterium]|jgi:N-acetylmuramoyl-L-alanine amidase|nr:glucosaminidase domain-containing protein [Helicobacteraceae bacterium]